MRDPPRYNVSVDAGQTLSNYRLIEKIGEGGTGVAWKADDTVLGRTVTIKVLPADVSAMPSAAKISFGKLGWPRRSVPPTSRRSTNSAERANESGKPKRLGIVANSPIEAQHTQVGKHGREFQSRREVDRIERPHGFYREGPACSGEYLL